MKLKAIPLLLLLPALMLLLLVACGGGDEPSDMPTPQSTSTYTPVLPTPIPTATTTPQSPKGTAATLQNVTLAETVHRPADSVQCETYESGQCAELRWQPVTGLRTGVVGALAISPSEPDVV